MAKGTKVKQKRATLAKLAPLALTKEQKPTTIQFFRKECRQFHQLPMPMAQLYPILLKRSLISLVFPKPYTGPQLRAHDSKLVCDFHFGEVGHSVKDCKVLKHRVQNLIDHGILIIDEALNMISTWPPNHHEGMTSMTDTSSMVTSSVRGDLPTSPYPQGLPFPSLLLNRGGSTSFSPQAEGPSEEAEHACHPCEKARSRPDS
jgi:hypothetical protein